MKTASHLKQLASESLVYGLSSVVNKFLYFILVPIYTRIFLPEDYGVMSLVTNSMSLVAIFVVLGLDSAAARWFYDTEDIEVQKETIASWAWCQLSVSVLFSLLIMGCANQLSREIVARSDAAAYFRLAALTLPLTALGTVVTNWLRLQRRPWATLLYSFGTSALSVSLILLLAAYLGMGLNGVYLAQLLAAAISTVVAVLLLREWISPLKVKINRLGEMLKYAVPLVPAGLSFWVVNLSGLYFIKRFASTADVGLYQVGSSISSAVAVLTAAFQQAWGPFALSIHKRDDARQVYADVLTAYMLLTCTLSLFLSLFSPEILAIVTTRNYLGANRVICLLSFNHILIGLTYIASVGATIAKTTRPYGIAVVLSSILTLVLNFIFVPKLGKEGSALATLIAQTCVPIMVFYLSQRLYRIPYRFSAAAGVFGLSLALSVAGTFIVIPDIALSLLLKLVMLAVLVSAVFAFRITTVAKLKFFLTSISQRNNPCQ